MSDTGLDLEARRRRIRFRAGHRGLRELDILMGGFARAEGGAFDADEVVAFERLLDVPDQTLLAWLMGDAPDPDFDTPMFRRLLSFARTREGQG
jgi:antitoxin CptB